MSLRSFSISKKQAFECPRRGGYQYVERRPVDVVSVEQFVGSLVHDIAHKAVRDFEVFHRPGSPATYTDLFTTRLLETLPTNLVIPRQGRSLDDYEALGHACLQTLVSELLPKIAAAERLLAVEQSIRYNVDDGEGGTITVFGRLDRLGEDRQTGAIVVHDWKTAGASLPWQEAVDTSQQIAVYLAWVRLRYPDRARSAMEHYLAFGQSFTTTRTDEDLNGITEFIRRETGKIEALVEFPARPNGLCRWCGYLPSCTEGQASCRSAR